MNSKDFKLFLITTKERYKSIGYIVCPAFNNEKVHFNHHGMWHLISKGNVPRPKDEVIERFSLLFMSYKLLGNIRYVDYEEKRIEGTSCAYFWTIKTFAGGQKVKIILRRINNGPIHFFSIMSE